MRVHARPDVSVRVLTDERNAAKLQSLVRRLQAKNVPVTLTDGVEYTVRARMCELRPSRTGRRTTCTTR